MERSRRALPATLVLLALTGLLVAGCGGGGGGEGFEEVAVGLRSAVRAQRPYDATSRTAGLSKAEEASLVSFCEATKQIVENRETAKLADGAYYLARIETDAEASLPFVSTRPVHVAVGKLQSLLDLSSFEAVKARAYARACYR